MIGDFVVRIYRKFRQHTCFCFDLYRVHNASLWYLSSFWFAIAITEVSVSRRSAQMCSIIFIGFVVFCSVYCSNPYDILLLASCTVVRSWCSEQQRGRAGCCTSSQWCTSISSSSAFIRSCQQLQGPPLCLQTLNKIDQCFLLWQEQEAGNCILTRNTMKCEFERDFRSNEHCLSNSESKAWN